MISNQQATDQNEEKGALKTQPVIYRVKSTGLLESSCIQPKLLNLPLLLCVVDSMCFLPTERASGWSPLEQKNPCSLERQEKKMKEERAQTATLSSRASKEEGEKKPKPDGDVITNGVTFTHTHTET